MDAILHLNTYGANGTGPNLARIGGVLAEEGQLEAFELEELSGIIGARFLVVSFGRGDSLFCLAFNVVKDLLYCKSLMIHFEIRKD